MKPRPRLLTPAGYAALAYATAILAVVIVVLLGTRAHGEPLPPGILPPPSTPGALNPNVTQANIATTICRSGWTATVRPPVSYTNKLKAQQMAALGLTGAPSLFEEDHATPLELGGNPTDPHNLWPEKWAGPCGAHRKDRIETLEKRLVCRGTITLAQAQHELQSSWVAAYIARIGPLDCTH